jgi:hypothetical protein
MEQGQRVQAVIARIDVIAARHCLGEDPNAETNPLVADLPGADTCPHTLAGSGTPITELDPLSNLGLDAVERWKMSPYRHHLYTHDTEAPRSAFHGGDLCHCGNTQANSLHQRCTTAGVEL